MFRPLKNLSFWLSGPVIVVLLTLGFIPLMWPIGSKYEGHYLPVVTDVDVQLVRVTGVGAIVKVKMTKLRTCELEHMFWVGEEGQRSVVVFPEDWYYDDNGDIVIDQVIDDPLSRPEGEHDTGEWLILGLKDLDSSTVTAIHRCHPLWLTYTHFFP